MPKPGAAGPRAVFGPVMVTGLLAVLAVAAVILHEGVLREGWLLPWLLLGLTAGYALSGSA